jgi:hypothetical protein
MTLPPRVVRVLDALLVVMLLVLQVGPLFSRVLADFHMTEAARDVKDIVAFVAAMRLWATTATGGGADVLEAIRKGASMQRGPNGEP